MAETAYINKKPMNKPLEKCLVFSPNYGWVMPSLDGWHRAYFYQSHKTARTAMKSRRYLEDAVVVGVQITVKEKGLSNEH